MNNDMGDSSRLVTIIRRHFGSEYPNLVGVEVGVHRGETSALLLREFPRLALFMVDPWASYDVQHPYRLSGDSCAKLTVVQQNENMTTAENATAFAGSRRMMIRKESVEASRDFAADRRTEFDFVFIDGDHTLPAVRADIAAWWPMVRSGGLLAGHDIDHPRDRRGLWGVRLAVEEHERTAKTPFEVSGSCWWFAKA